MKKKVAVFLALVMLLLSGAEAFAGELSNMEGIVIISPSTAGDPDLGEGLEITMTKKTVEVLDDFYCEVIIDIEIMNWEPVTVELEGALEAKLFYHEDYSYDAFITYEKPEVAMLVSVDGKLVFTVPYIVALAEADELTLEITNMGEVSAESIDLTEAAQELREESDIRFRYDERVSDSLEMMLGEAYLMDSWNGEQDEDYVYIIQPVSFINWSKDSLLIPNQVYVLLVYLNKYGVESSLAVQSRISTLAVASGELVFKTPKLITERAQAGDLELRMRVARVAEEEWAEDFALPQTSPEEEATEPEEEITIDNSKIKEEISFGYYNNSPIDWIVLSVQNDRALLLSKDRIASRRYDDSKNIDWETSEIRQWLNDTFYAEAFTRSEQDYIIRTRVRVSADSNSTKTVNDYVFLLSKEEVLLYLPTVEDHVTGYYWFLRTTGNTAVGINKAGDFNEPPSSLITASLPIRAAMWVYADLLDS